MDFEHALYSMSMPLYVLTDRSKPHSRPETITSKVNPNNIFITRNSFLI